MHTSNLSFFLHGQNFWTIPVKRRAFITGHPIGSGSNQVFPLSTTLSVFCGLNQTNFSFTLSKNCDEKEAENYCKKAEQEASRIVFERHSSYGETQVCSLTKKLRSRLLAWNVFWTSFVRVAYCRKKQSHFIAVTITDCSIEVFC